jgi:hypothetical protein
VEGGRVKIDRNYQQAMIQVANANTACVEALGTATALMIAGRAVEAIESLDAAKTILESALTSAKWATTLPAPEDK